MVYGKDLIGQWNTLSRRELYLGLVNRIPTPRPHIFVDEQKIMHISIATQTPIPLGKQKRKNCACLCFEVMMCVCCTNVHYLGV